jgi:hypothetical protein
MPSSAVVTQSGTAGGPPVWPLTSVIGGGALPNFESKILYKSEPGHLLMPLRFSFEPIRDEVTLKGFSSEAMREKRSFPQKHGKRRKQMRGTGRIVTNYVGPIQTRAVNSSIPSLNANIGKLFLTPATNEGLRSDGRTLLVDRGLPAPGNDPRKERHGIRVIDDLIFSAELLEPGWECPEALAPSGDILRDAYLASCALPAETVEPEVEVDIEVGTLRLIWTSPNGRRSFALVFRGTGKVIGVFTCLDGTDYETWSLPVAKDVGLAIRFEDTLVESVLFGK